MRTTDNQVDVEIFTVAVPPRVGGMTAWFHQIAEGLSQLGWTVRLYGISDNWVERMDASYQRISIPALPPGSIPVSVIDKWQRWRMICRKVLHQIDDRPLPRLRLTDSTPGVLHLGRELRERDQVPWIVVAGGDVFAETSETPLTRWFHKRIRADLNSADAILVDGPDLVESLTERGVFSHLFRICYHGIDTDLFVPKREAPRFFPSGSEALRVAWHGRLGEHHGPLRFLDIVSSLDRVEPRLCGGEGDQMSEVLSRLEKIGKPEWYLGVLPEKELVVFLSEADCGIYPLRGTAGTPTVVLEAMAAGLACVVTQVGAVTEIIRSGSNGFICNDDKEMLEVIHRLTEDPGLRKAVGEKARQTIEKDWSEKATTRKLQETLEEFIKS